jgi:hypothetical protein
MTKFFPYAGIAFALLVTLVMSSPVIATITCTVSAGVAISDLSAHNPTKNSIDLTWTTPKTGPHRFRYFDVRYSKAVILSDNWDEATRATGEPAPVPGARQRMTVGGLDSRTRYYFAIKIVDVEGLDSALSNIAVGTTLAIYLTPMSKFEIDNAKFEFNKKPSNDSIYVQGELKLDLVHGNGVDISELVTVTVGPVSETITMVAKGRRGEEWQYSRPRGYKGIIEDMTINWRKGEFDFSMDKVDLRGVTNPVTISIQIGDDIGKETILMREKRNYWEYNVPHQRHWWEWWR